MSTNTIDAATMTELPLRTGAWTSDPHHSAVLFSIRHLGLAKVRGRFDRFDVRLDVGQTMAATSIEATIEMDSIDTNNADRDAHLRSTDFFSTEANPTMRFVSHEISADGADWQLGGLLTLNGVTQPVGLRVEFNGVEVFPNTTTRYAGFSASGTIKRSDFGIDFGMLPLSADKLALGDEVKIELDLEFVEPQD